MFVLISSSFQYYQHIMRHYDGKRISLEQGIYIYDSPFYFNNGTIEYNNDDPEPQNLAIFKQISDQRLEQIMNITVIINSPVKQLCLFAITKHRDSVKIINSNITFVLNAYVEQFAGISSSLMNATIVNTNLMLNGDSAIIHGSISILANKLGAVNLINTNIISSLTTQTYNGLSMNIEGDSSLDTVMFQGKIKSIYASGLAAKLSGSLTLTNITNTQYIIGQMADSTLGIKEITVSGQLSISNSQFNAVLASTQDVAGRVFYSSSNGTVTVNNIHGNITGNWETWCGTSCNLPVDNFNNIVIPASQLQSLTPTNQLTSLYQNNNSLDLNNTKITIEGEEVTMSQSGKFSLFQGFKYFYNITIQAKNIIFTNNCDVGFLYSKENSEPVKINKVNIYVNIKSSGTIALLSLNAKGSVNIHQLFVNETVLSANQYASMFFNSTEAGASVIADEICFGNQTQVYGKGGIGGLIREVRSYFSLTNSNLDFVITAEDLADSSAFVYKSNGGSFNFLNNMFTLHGIYTTTNCVQGGPCNLPTMTQVSKPQITITNPTIFNQISNNKNISCLLDPRGNYNSTIISVNYAYDAEQTHHSVFCNHSMFYNITVQNSQIQVTNSLSSGIFTTALQGNTIFNNTQINNVNLISSAPSGLLTGYADGQISMINVSVNGSIKCTNQICGGIIGQTNSVVRGDNVTFWGTVEGDGQVASVVGEMGGQSITITNANIYASVTSTGVDNKGRAICSNNRGNANCDVSGTIQVSGRYQGCPGPSTTENGNKCQRLTVSVDANNFNLIPVTTTDPFGRQIVYGKSGILPQQWNLNRSKIEYQLGDYSSLQHFSFFGNDKKVFNDIIVTGPVQLGTAQGFAGFVFATNNANDVLSFQNCEVQVNVQGSSSNAAGFIFSNAQNVEIQQSRFTGRFSNCCHVAGYIYYHGGGGLTLQNLLSSSFSIISTTSSCQNWNSVPFASAIVVGHINSVKQYGNRQIQLNNIQFSSVQLEGTGYVGGIVAAIDGNYNIRFDQISLYTVDIVGNAQYPFGTFVGKMAGSGQYQLGSFSYTSGQTNLKGKVVNQTVAGLFIGQKLSNLVKNRIILQPNTNSVFGTCPYGYSSTDYGKSSDCANVFKSISVNTYDQFICDSNPLDQNYYSEITNYTSICYFKKFLNGNFNNTVINVNINDVIDVYEQRKLPGPFILTLFPPKYKYFVNIKITGYVKQSKKNHDMAFSFFVPYIVEDPSIFINCTLDSYLSISSIVENHNAILAKFAVTAYSDVYFYDINSTINYYKYAKKDYHVWYGGFLMSAQISSNVYFSKIYVSDYAASQWFFGTYDVSNQQAQLILNNYGICTIQTGMYQYFQTGSMLSNYNTIAVTIQPKCYFKDNRISCRSYDGDACYFV